MLLINLGLLAWGYRHDSSMQRPQLEITPGVGNLRLLSEGSEATPRVAGQQDAMDEAEAVVSMESPAIHEEPSSLPEADLREAEADLRQVEAALREVEEELRKVKADESVEVAVENSARQSEEMEISSSEPTGATESPPILMHTEDDMATQVVDEPAPPAVVVLCGTLGNWNKRADAARIAVDLMSQEITARVQEEITQVKIGYWVLIPPSPSREEAKKKVKELAGAGIRDVWHFQEGELENAISVGLFEERENATKRKHLLNQNGFEADVMPRFVERPRYRLEFQLNTDQSLEEDVWRQLQGKYPKFELREHPCGSLDTSP